MVGQFQQRLPALGDDFTVEDAGCLEVPVGRPNQIARDFTRRVRLQAHVGGLQAHKR